MSHYSNILTKNVLIPELKNDLSQNEFQVKWLKYSTIYVHQKCVFFSIPKYSEQEMIKKIVLPIDWSIEKKTNNKVGTIFMMNILDQNKLLPKDSQITRLTNIAILLAINEIDWSISRTNATKYQSWLLSLYSTGRAKFFCAIWNKEIVTFRFRLLHFVTLMILLLFHRFVRNVAYRQKPKILQLYQH